MSLRADTNQMIAGCLMASRYAGLGIVGSMVPFGGANGASIIWSAMVGAVLPTTEYRLLLSAPLPQNMTLNEDSSGTYTGAQTSVGAMMRLFADGVEV